MQDVGELVDRYMEENNMFRVEGRAGLVNLCRLARALGYRDPQHYGQMTSQAAIGDLMMFLEDNSGAIESVIDWVKQQRSPEWREALAEQVTDNEEDNNEEAEED